MNAAQFRSTLSALLCAAAVPLALAQNTSSSSSSSTSTATPPATSTPGTTTTAPNAASTTANPAVPQTAPGTVTTPAAPFSPPPVTNPVPGAVVPPTGTPTQGPRTAPSAVTQPFGPGVPPGSTNASTQLDANGQRIVVSGASIDALAAAGVEVAVDPQNALSNLRRADATGQQGVTAELQTRLDATSRALTEARAQSRAAGFPLTDSAYDQTVAEIRLREDVLRETLRNATTANSEPEWRQLQSVLDSQYSAYADAVLRAHRLLQQAPQR